MPENSSGTASMETKVATDGSDAIDNRFALSTLEAEIEAMALCARPLDDIMRELVEDKSVITDDERAIINGIYAAGMLKALPNELAKFYHGIFRAGDEEAIFDWLDAFSGEFNVEHTATLFRASQAITNLLKLHTYLPKRFVENILRDARRAFSRALDLQTNLRGELGIYRSLRVCASNPSYSSTFCKTVKKMWAKCINANEEISVTADEGAEEHDEHRIFQRVIDGLPDDFVIQHDFVKNYIKSLFVALEPKILVEGKNRILQFEGRQFSLQQIIDRIYNELDKNRDFSEIRLVAKAFIVVDTDLELPSMNISLIASEVRVPTIVSWSLRGKDAELPRDWKHKAKSGEEKGEDGENGMDGFAGQGGGQVYVKAKQILISKEARWSVDVCGGAGTPGQNGGDGANGEDGIGRKWEEVFTTTRLLGDRSVLTADALPLSALRRAITRISGSYENKEEADGVKYICSKGAHLVSNHIFIAYRGTEGKSGGRGGRNGCGGDGGKKGSFVAMSPSGEKLTHNVQVDAQDGTKGRSGQPGHTGLNGVDGNDVVAACTTVRPWRDYETRSNNKKIQITFVATNEEDAYYVPDLYTGEGSLCYIKAVNPETVTRKALSDSEREGERKSDGERQGQAIAKQTSAIDMRAIDMKYEDIFRTNTQNEIAEERTEEVEINRLAVRIEVPVIDRYSPKRPIPNEQLTDDHLAALLYSSESLEGLWKNPMQITFVSHLDNLARNHPSSRKLRTKALVTKCRNVDNHYGLTEDFEDLEVNPTVAFEKKCREAKAKYRDCYRFLAPSAQEALFYPALKILVEGEDAAVVNALKKALDLRLGPTLFMELEEIMFEWRSLRLQDEPLESFEPHFDILMKDNNYKLLATAEDSAQEETEEDNPQKQHVEEIYRGLSAGASSEELKRIEEVWKKTKVRLGKFAFEIAEEHPDAALSLAFIRMFVVLKRVLDANRALAIGCQLIAQVIAEEEDRVALADLLSDKPNIIAWLALLEVQDQRVYFTSLIQALGTKSAAGRALIAWNTKVNLRLYSDGKLVEDHYPESKSTFHLNILPNGKFVWLQFEEEQLRLFNDRGRDLEIFVKCLQDESPDAFKLLGAEELIVSEVCSTCGKEEHSIVDEARCGLLEDKLNEIVLAVQGSKVLFDFLKLFVNEYRTSGRLFINVLRTIFDVDGVHVDAEDLIFMVETAIETCSLGGTSEWTFASLLLRNPQNEWLDAFFALSVENTLKRSLTQRGEVRKRSRQLADTRLKILCAKKLKEEVAAGEQEQCDENFVLEILKSLKNATTVYVELKSRSMKTWSVTVRESHAYYVLTDSCKNAREEDRGQLIFWGLKLAKAYGVDEAERAISFLISQKFSMKEDEVMQLRFAKVVLLDLVGFSRLIHYLCNDELDSPRQHLPIHVLRVLLRHNFNRNIAEEVRTTADDKNVEQIQRIVQKFCFTRHPSETEPNIFEGRRKDRALTTERTPEKVFKLIRHNNVEAPRQALKKKGSLQRSSSRTDAEVHKRDQDQLNKREDFITRLERSLGSGDAWQLADELVQQALQRLKEGDPFRPGEFYHHLDSLRPDNVSMDELLLAVVDGAILEVRGFQLRHNQQAAILAALRSEAVSKRGLLQEIATGEGKSLIITSLAIIGVLQGQTVHILSSSSTLAKRDTESEPPRGCKDLYDLFGITAGHICVDNSYERQNVYSSCDVVYGDITSFQRDYLLDEFYGMKITGSRRFETILVDEVDSMVLDQGNNMLYLSHDIPDMEFLQPLLVHIWKEACLRIDGGRKFDVDEIVEGVRRSVFPILELDHLTKDIGVDITKAAEIRETLVNRGVVERSGIILVKDFEEAMIKVGNNFEKIIQSRLKFTIQQALNKGKISIPRHLRAFVRTHLRSFVESARSAYFMEEGRGYQVDILKSEVAIQHEPRVVIVDQSTGVDLPSTQWSNGLHQFLQLKHGLRLTALSLKAVFVSNVSFLKKYQRIYGFSGTLGAEAEQMQLRTLYEVDCLKLPSSLPKLIHEECSHVSTNRATFAASIYTSIARNLQRQRSILVVCDSVKQVDTLNNELKVLAKQQESPFVRNFDSMIRYRRDRDRFDYGDGNKLLECGQIILATNLAGRGTDIKLDPKLIENGGLHVIVAFLPPNIRVEEQAFGRVARCGEPGSTQLLILNEDDEHEADISLLKMHRNTAEEARVHAITTFYEHNICVEEECFYEFVTCFETQRQRFDKQMDLDDEAKQLLQRDLLDRWAYWLDETMAGASKTNGRSKEVVREAANFCQTLDLPENKPTQPLNRLRWGIQQMLNENIEVPKRFEDAVVDFEYVKENFPFFAAEANYYLAFIIIKTTDKGTIFGRSGTSKRDLDPPMQFFTLIPMQFLVSAQSP